MDKKVREAQEAHEAQEEKTDTRLVHHTQSACDPLVAYLMCPIVTETMQDPATVWRRQNMRQAMAVSPHCKPLIKIPPAVD